MALLSIYLPVYIQGGSITSEINIFSCCLENWYAERMDRNRVTTDLPPDVFAFLTAEAEAAAAAPAAVLRAAAEVLAAAGPDGRYLAAVRKRIEPVRWGGARAGAGRPRLPVAK